MTLPEPEFEWLEINGKRYPRMLPRVASNGPGILRKGWNYAQAFARWELAGKPVRSQEQIDALYVLCEACPAGLFRDGVCNHSSCGCPINRETQGRNKLLWATESCPLEPPVWVAEVS